MATGLENIDHVVVLMLENRSFDNMLGDTFEPGVRRVNSFYPSSTSGHTFPVPAFTLPGREFFQASIPTPDPGEFFQYMHQQLYGLRHPLPVNKPVPGNAPAGPLGEMGGFVQNYLQVLGDYHYWKFLLPFIMHGFTADQLPVTTELGRSFAVVDTYFASAPCQTMPNRCFAQLGTAQGFVNNDTYTGSYNDHRSNAPYLGRTIFNDIDDTSGIDWRVYFGDFPLTLLMADTWLDFVSHHKFHFFDHFAEDVQSGTLPAYTWIEPAYQLFPTDNHPPHDVNLGEYLLAEVYNTLRSCPEVWEKTLLVVTYDEHGGCYDHVFPPPAVPPEPPAPGAVFAFDRYGVRLPTLLVSPYVAAGTVGTPGASGPDAPVYDHTSILATVRSRFDVARGPLSAREAAAHDFSAFLTLEPGHLNQGPESVSVGISREELEIQAVLETVSGLGQLIWESIHKIPATPEEAERALADLRSRRFDRTPPPRPPTDAELLRDLQGEIRRLFGRVPTGLLRFEQRPAE